MKKTKAFNLVVVLAVSALLLSAVNAQTIPEEARRHMARGQAAVEIAKSPEELEDAIKEFKEAIKLAPDWPEPYYNLAVIQEKIGKFKEAVASLTEYLRLAPNAPDAAKIQEQIYKLEYKAEQVLTVPEIIDVLVSLRDEQIWQVTGDCSTYHIEFKPNELKGDGWVSVYSVFFLDRPPERRYNPYRVEGSVFEYRFIANTCVGDYQNDSVCFGEEVIEVEVVSKTLAKIRQKTIKQDPNNYIPKGERSCIFQKKIADRSKRRTLLLQILSNV